MPCVWILSVLKKERGFLVLTCLCSVPAHPPEGEREPHYNEFHFTSNQSDQAKMLKINFQ